MHTEEIVSNYLAEIDNPGEGLRGCTPRDIHDHIISRYETISRKMIAYKKRLCNEGMDTSRSLEIYVHNQENCQ